jgi:hypothetical protein
MAPEIERKDPDAQGMLVLRTEDGAWYQLPVAALERVRVTDPAQFDEVRGQLAAEGFDADSTSAGEVVPIVLLTEETLAPYRASEDRAAALEAAGEVAGFSYHEGQFTILGNNERIKVVKWEGFPTESGGKALSPVLMFVLATSPSVRFGSSRPYLA